MRVVLSIYSSRDSRQVVVDTPRFTIGRDASSSLVLQDDGVSSLHASINTDGNRIWVLDEGSANGTLLDGQRVPPVGQSIRDGAEISVGHDTTIVVNLESEPVQASTSQQVVHNVPVPSESPGISLTLVGVLLGALLLLIAGVVVFASYTLRSKEEKKIVRQQDQTIANDPSPLTTESPSPDASGSVSSPEIAVTDPSPQSNGQQGTVSRKLYLQMSQQEQMEFIDQQARHISLMMGNRPYAFNDDVLRYIKQYVDGYAKRVGNGSNRLWGEDLRFMFARAREQYAPHISRAFNSRGVPPVVGLYLVVVETEYHNIQSENSAGAAGLFQFIGPTARGYGVEPSERTNVAKMAPAAAAYMADRIAEFGPDSMSVALGIAGYNRSPDSVRRDLRDVLNSENRERSFWTLVANSNKLDHYFQGENIKYVPKFFAAAIVGETPWAFGIQMQPLSTYTEIKPQPQTAEGQ